MLKYSNQKEDVIVYGDSPYSIQISSNMQNVIVEKNGERIEPKIVSESIQFAQKGFLVFGSPNIENTIVKGVTPDPPNQSGIKFGNSL